MSKNIFLIIQREFNERVRKKSFIITTLLMPLLMLAIMIIPGLIMAFATGEEKQIAVIDQSGHIAPSLHNEDEIRFEIVDMDTEEARKSLTDRYAILYIGSNVVDNPSEVRLYVNTSSSMAVESSITEQISKIIEKEKLKRYDIEDLDKILADVSTEVSMQVFRNDKSQEDDTQAQSSTVATVLGYVMSFTLYMFILIYGSMVMQAVIEEKSSRVLEVLVSSVRPFDLMMGKILGIASVAVVQILIWAVLVVGIGSMGLPSLLPDEVMTSAAAIQQGGSIDMARVNTVDLNPEMLQAVATATDVGYMTTLFTYLLLFLLGGYLFYSAMYAAVGSAVENVQDSSQLQMPITLPIILSLMLSFVVIKDPTSPVSFWASMIPFTSPIVMIARIPYDIPTWEIILSLVILYTSFIGMVWFAGKIYRVGIFMYGKKPSFKEIFKWMNYKY